MHLRLLSLLLGFAASAMAASVSHRSLLEDAVENWLGERDHWSFTQRAVEFERGERRERLERFDPSQSGNRRWTLLAIDGKPPSPSQREAWAKKKFRKKPRRFEMPIGDFFDFKDARIIEETPGVVRYNVPLRGDRNWLFQADKVDVVVTVNKETRGLQHLQADVMEPVKVLLGLARITDGSLDLSFLSFGEGDEPGPSNSQPTGTAHVVVSRFGERVEFTWFDFKRVNPAAVEAARHRSVASP